MSENTKNSGIYFPGLNSLRAIAFLGVYLSHTGIRAFSYSGGAGVSIFLVMSGFLLMYRSMWGGTAEIRFHFVEALTSLYQKYESFIHFT